VLIFPFNSGNIAYKLLTASAGPSGGPHPARDEEAGYRPFQTAR